MKKLKTTHAYSLSAARLAVGLAVGMGVSLACLSTVQAQVPETVAARLGADLTPVGAEKAGNAEGTIPAWTGGLSAPPAGLDYHRGQHYKDPFASDPVQFTITGANMAQHADKLSEGQKSLLSTYPSYKMNVYQSRRTCALPKKTYHQLKRNATIGTLAPDGNGIEGAVLASPFPIPNNPLEIVWNHSLRYRAYKIAANTVNAVPTRSGDYTPIIAAVDTIIAYSNPGVTRTEELDNTSVYILIHTTAPARAAGSVTLVHETLNQIKGVRKAWQYSPGTRRVRRAPNISYDNPGTNTDGLSTSDSFDMYNGAPDRYDWTVNGKLEKYIPYNAYKMGGSDLQYDDIIKPLHPNQDLLRYELHRVWEIEANLKAGARHLYSRRVMGLDEDSWGISTTSLYDGRGELWRSQERWAITAYDFPLCSAVGGVVYDPNAGRYLIAGLVNQEETTNYDAQELSMGRYTPAAMKRISGR
ncbi:MAG: DUF1329 domain-containing protein, partial [Parvibaculaceae bacterium]|nr:DUF1329 domain-containing protein [Parvibaculaceae bacterium]